MLDAIPESGEQEPPAPEPHQPPDAGVPVAAPAADKAAGALTANAKVKLGAKSGAPGQLAMPTRSKRPAPVGPLAPSPPPAKAPRTSFPGAAPKAASRNGLAPAASPSRGKAAEEPLPAPVGGAAVS